MAPTRSSPWDRRPPARKRWKPDPTLKVVAGVVLRDGVRLYGLKSSLMNTFWPHFKHVRAPRKCNYGHSAKVGVIIEEQIDEWFSSGRRPGRFEARIFCGLMVAHGLRRVASQAPVAHGSVGTRVDWVVADKSGREILIELKTGHNYGMNAAQGCLRHFSDFSNTRLQHAQFQLLWTWAALSARGVETEPWLVVINNGVKKLFSAGDSIAEIAAKIRAKVRTSKRWRLERPLPRAHRKLTAKVLEVVR